MLDGLLHVPGQLTGPVPTQPPIGQHSTPAPPYVQLLQLQIWHSTISSQSERTCPSSISISTSTMPVTKLTTSRVKATLSTAFTLDVVSFVTGIVEVEIEMLDGHVRSL